MKRLRPVLGLLMLTLSACGPPHQMTTGSEHVGLRNGLLLTEWNQDSAPAGEVYHVLIVATDLHQGNVGPHSSSSGGTAELRTLEVSFELPGARTIGLEAEVAAYRRFRAAGREFDLRDGNLIVCVLSETGDAELTQLPESLREKGDVATRLKAFHDQLEPDHPARAAALYPWTQ